jgi:alpha-L-arabinofuranosidase
MQKIRSLIVSIVLVLAGASSAISQGTETTVIINADQGKVQISENIYGHFSEHLGRCIYGGFYVGENNALIPNTGGVRNDVIKALREMKIPNLRWPGGCFADTYHWKDGVGPKAERPSMVNKWWGGVTEDNSFGTHDFLNLCERLGADPYLAANVGSGTVKELADWVQYVNHDGGSPMADWRRKNGRKDPWKVKYWGVGNEMWGCGGHMTPEHYADVYKQYATFMTDWRNNDGLYRIASGANVDDYNWTEVLLKNIPKNLIEGVALHSYSTVKWSDKGSATDFNEFQYFSTMKSALRMEELVTRHSTIMDKYDPDKRIGLVVDEWGGWYNVEEGTNPGFLYQQNTMRDAMIAGATLNIFNNHADRVKMANLAQTVNVLQAVILTNEERMLLTPTYYVMKMYSVHQDALLLPVDFTNVDYTCGDEKLPALSVSASKNQSGVVHVSIVNIDPNNSRALNLDLRGYAFKTVTGTILTSVKIQDHNTFEQPTKVTPREFKAVKAAKGRANVEMPPFSVVVLELK